MDTFATVGENLLARFVADGVVCIRGALSNDEVELLREAVSQQIAGRHASPTSYDFEAISRQVWDASGRVDVGEANRMDVAMLAEAIRFDPQARPLLEDDEASEDGMFLYEAAGWRRHREIRKVAFDSALPRIAAQLMGSETVRFWEDTTFVKAPHTRQKTAFHQDLPFTQIEGQQCLVAWIPLDRADAESGVVRHVRGSHAWQKTYCANMLLSQTPIPGAPYEKCPDIEAEEDRYDIITFEVEPGDVIIHDIRTLHGAGGNRSERMRRAISFRYCGDDVRYFDRPGTIPQADVRQPLKTGDRLESVDYPLVWPRPWPSVSLAELYEQQDQLALHQRVPEAA